MNENMEYLRSKTTEVLKCYSQVCFHVDHKGNC